MRSSAASSTALCAAESSEPPLLLSETLLAESTSSSDQAEFSKLASASLPRLRLEGWPSSSCAGELHLPEQECARRNTSASEQSHYHTHTSTTASGHAQPTVPRRPYLVPRSHLPAHAFSAPACPPRLRRAAHRHRAPTCSSAPRLVSEPHTCACRYRRHPPSLPRAMPPELDRHWAHHRFRFTTKDHPSGGHVSCNRQ